MYVCMFYTRARTHTQVVACVSLYSESCASRPEIQRLTSSTRKEASWHASCAPRTLPPRCDSRADLVLAMLVQRLCQGSTLPQKPDAQAPMTPAPTLSS